MADKLKSMEIIKVIDQLIGSTTAVGESNYDRDIDNNLTNLIDLIDWALKCVADSAKTRHRYEGSMRNIGERAFSALCEWKDWIDVIINLD